MTKPPEQYYPQPERDDLAFRMFAAWINCDPCMVPTQFKAWTCPQTRQAWGRVAEAARSDPAVRALVEAAQKARAGLGWAHHHLDEAGINSLSVNLGIQYIDAALAAFNKTD